MNTYTSLPEDIHGEIIKYMDNTSLLKSRRLSIRFKNYVYRYATYLSPSVINININELYVMKYRCIEKKIFKKILFIIEFCDRINKILLLDIIENLKEKNDLDGIVGNMIMDDNDDDDDNSGIYTYTVPNIEYIQLFAEALKINKSLRELWINYSVITDESAISISEMLKVNNSLHVLYMNYCKLSTAGVIAIAEVLKVNKSLQNLNIAHIQITLEGVIAITEALKINTSLHILSISDNNICSDGVSAIIEALKVNNTLQMLLIGGTTNITTKDTQLLRDIEDSKDNFKIYL